VLSVVDVFNHSKSVHHATSPERLRQLYRGNVSLMQALRGCIHNLALLGYRRATGRAQSVLAQSGFLLQTIQFINYPDQTVTLESLAVLCAILKGANMHAQRVFLDFFLNTRDETFFADIAGLIDRAGNTIIEKRLLRSHVEAESRRLPRDVTTMTMNAVGGCFSGSSVCMHAHFLQTCVQDGTGWSITFYKPDTSKVNDRLLNVGPNCIVLRTAPHRHSWLALASDL
jgi:hypothetical protein